MSHIISEVEHEIAGLFKHHNAPAPPPEHANAAHVTEPPKSESRASRPPSEFARLLIATLGPVPVEYWEQTTLWHMLNSGEAAADPTALTTALLFGASAGSVELVSLVLDQFLVPIDSLAYPGVCLDCEPIVECANCPEGHGIGMESALISACLSGSVHMVEYLLSRGADANVGNEFGRTPLHCACKYGSIECVELLLDKQASVNAVTVAGVTPLHTANGCGFEDIAALLLSRGADETVRDQHGYTASDAAKFVVVEEPAPPVQEDPVEPQPVVPVDAAIVAEGGRPPVEDPLVADSLSDVPQGVVATEDSLLATEALAGDEGSLVADAAAAEPLNEEEPSPDVTVQDASLLSTLVPDLNEVKASSEAPTARITASPATAGSKMLISKGKRLGDQSYFTVSVSQLPSGDVRFNSVSVRDAGLVFKRNVSLSELATLSDKHCDSVAEVHAAVAVLFDRLVVLDNRLEFPEPMVAPAAVDATTPAKTSARLSVRTLEHDLAGLFKHREAPVHELQSDGEALVRPAARGLSPTTSSAKVLVSKGKRLGDLSYFTVTVSQLASGDIRFSAVSVRDAGLVFKRTVPLSELSILSGETCESDAGVQSAVAVLFDRVVIVNSRLEFLVSAAASPSHRPPSTEATRSPSPTRYLLARVAKKVPGVGYATVTASSSGNDAVQVAVSGMDATLRVTKSYSVDELSNLSSVPIALLQGYTLRAVCKAVCEAVAVDAGQLVLGTVEVTSLQRLGTPLSPTRFAAESPTAASRSKVLISKGKRLGDLSYFTVTAHLLPSGDIRFSAVSARDAGLVFKRTVTVSELATLSGETCDSESSISRAVSVLPSRITLTDGTLDFVTKPPSSRASRSESRMLARVAKKIPGVGYGTVTATASFDGTVLFTVSGGNQTFTRTAVMNWTTDAPAAAKAVCEAIAVVNGAIELPETSAATYQPPQSPPRLMPSSPSPATVGARVLISKGKRLGDLSYFTVTVSLLPSGDIRFSAVSARDASLSIKRNVSMSELSALSSEPCDSEASIKRAANQLFDRLLVVDGGIDFREAATPGPPSRSSSPSRSVLARTGRKMEGLGYVTITAAQTSGDGSISITVMAADGSACIRGLFSPPDLSSHVPIDTVSEPLPAQAAYVCVHLSVENGAIVLPTVVLPSPSPGEDVTVAEAKSPESPVPLLSPTPMTPSSSIIFSRGQKIASYGFVTVAVYKLPGADIRVSVVNARDPSQRYRTTIPVAYVESKTGVSVGSDADLTAACKRLCDGVGITASGEIAFGADDAVASPAMPALAEPVVKDVVMTEPAPAAIIVDDPTAPQTNDSPVEGLIEQAVEEVAPAQPVPVTDAEEEAMARRTAAIRIQCLARRKAAEGKVTAARSRKAEIERELQAAVATALVEEERRAEEEAAKASAAVRIQSQARRRAAHARVSKLKAERSSAVSEVKAAEEVLTEANAAVEANGITVTSPNRSKHAAATKIQAQARRRAAERHVRALRELRQSALQKVSQVNRELDAALVDESKIKAEDEDDEVDMRHNAALMIQRQARRRAATLRVAKLRAELDAAAHEVIAAEHAIQADLAAGKEAEEAEERGDQEEEEEETPVDEEPPSVVITVEQDPDSADIDAEDESAAVVVQEGPAQSSAAVRIQAQARRRAAQKRVGAMRASRTPGSMHEVVLPPPVIPDPEPTPSLPSTREPSPDVDSGDDFPGRRFSSIEEFTALADEADARAYDVDGRLQYTFKSRLNTATGSGSAFVQPAKAPSPISVTTSRTEGFTLLPPPTVASKKSSPINLFEDPVARAKRLAAERQAEKKAKLEHEAQLKDARIAAKAAERVERQKAKAEQSAAKREKAKLRAVSIVSQYEMEREKKRDQVLRKTDPLYQPPTASVYQQAQRDIISTADVVRRTKLFGTTDLRSVPSTQLSEKIHSVSYVQQHRSRGGIGEGSLEGDSIPLPGIQFINNSNIMPPPRTADLLERAATYSPNGKKRSPSPALPTSPLAALKDSPYLDVPMPSRQGKRKKKSSKTRAPSHPLDEPFSAIDITQAEVHIEEYDGDDFDGFEVEVEQAIQSAKASPTGLGNVGGQPFPDEEGSLFSGGLYDGSLDDPANFSHIATPLDTLARPSSVPTDIGVGPAPSLSFSKLFSDITGEKEATGEEALWVLAPGAKGRLARMQVQQRREEAAANAKANAKAKQSKLKLNKTATEPSLRMPAIPKSRGGRPMPYLDVPVRTAADIPAPGAYRIPELGKSKAARWGKSDAPGSLEVIIRAARKLPGPADYGLYKA